MEEAAERIEGDSSDLRKMDNFKLELRAVRGESPNKNCNSEGGCFLGCLLPYQLPTYLSAFLTVCHASARLFTRRTG